MAPKTPGWEMPERERDERVPKERARRISAMETLKGDITPPPHEITAADAWSHSTAIAERTANALMEIANSAGRGMEVGDEIRDLQKDQAATRKKFKWWQALAIAALTGAGGAIFGVARVLYMRGEKDGVNEMRLQAVERQVERNTENIERVREDINRLIRYRLLGPVIEPEPVRKP